MNRPYQISGLRPQRLLLYRFRNFRYNPGMPKPPRFRRRVSAASGASGSQTYTWLALHKPADTVTTRHDPEGRRTVYAFLPPGLPRLEAVGRLDRATTGLLLFTNDFKLGQALLDPEAGLARVYQVVTDAPLPEQARDILSRGVLLADGTFCGPVKIQAAPLPAPERSYHFTLREGKNREVRRLVEHFGRKVRGLHRLSFGPVRIDDLKPGQVRLLSPAEITGLQRSMRMRARSGRLAGKTRRLRGRPAKYFCP